VDPIPPLFKKVIKRIVKWQVLPPTCIPNSCIVNIYEEGDCIPPHIDHHDFVRPFCNLSLLSECKIVFGSTLKVVGPGEFSGPFSLPLPVGYVRVIFQKTMSFRSSIMSYNWIRCAYRIIFNRI
jgi:alkylated DNA repair protein alkB family protein 5